MKTTAEEVFEVIKFHCNPDKGPHLLFDLFFGGMDNKSNFIGGINDDRNTLHENMFQMMFPKLTPQVHFGTGKGGYKKYLSKRYTADFYDENNDTIYEIDGSNHNEEIQQLKDKIRDAFFWKELGIRTIRYTNEEVERKLMSHLLNLEETGELHELLKSKS